MAKRKKDPRKEYKRKHKTRNSFFLQSPYSFFPLDSSQFSLLLSFYLCPPTFALMKGQRERNWSIKDCSSTAGSFRREGEREGPTQKCMRQSFLGNEGEKRTNTHRKFGALSRKVSLFLSDLVAPSSTLTKLQRGPGGLS